MAKTIKFNLICDEKPVRTIEDLQNNFSIEDVLEYYQNRLLHRWLSVRGYDSELEAVSAITSDEPMEIIKELIRIFGVVADEEKVEESIYILEYLRKRKAFCATYAQENYNTTRIIKDYEAGYRQLVDGILKNPNDAAKIKANIAEIVSHYEWIFELNHRELFYRLQNKSILAIMCLLMNEKTRGYYLPVKTTGKDGTSISDIQKNADQESMFNAICKIVKRDDFESALGDNLFTFSGMTDGYWKDLEPKGKRYMIVNMENGDYVRSAGETGGGKSYKDVSYRFLILDGIDYKSNYNYNKLCYMEV